MGSAGGTSNGLFDLLRLRSRRMSGIEACDPALSVCPAGIHSPAMHPAAMYPDVAGHAGGDAAAARTA
jgi:hypothetical protein